MKCIFLLVARKQLIESITIISRVYESNQDNQRIWPVFDAFIKKLSLCVKALLGFYALAFVSIVHAPILIFLVIYEVCDDVERRLAVSLMIPGTSLNVDAHYELNLIFQAFFAQLNGLIYMHFDGIFVVVLLHVILVADIVCDKIRATEQLLVAELPSRPTEITASLRDVIRLQNELRE